MLSLIILALGEVESLKYSVDMLLSCILFCDTRLSCFIVSYNPANMFPSTHLKKVVVKGESDNFSQVVSVSCSKLAEFLHAAFISVKKHYPVIFFTGLLLVFEKQRMQKPSVFKSSIFCRCNVA